jgi:hypothetical protein
MARFPFTCGCGGGVTEFCVHREHESNTVERLVVKLTRRSSSLNALGALGAYVCPPDPLALTNPDPLVFFSEAKSSTYSSKTREASSSSALRFASSASRSLSFFDLRDAPMLKAASLFLSTGFCYRQANGVRMRARERRRPRWDGGGVRA